MITAASLLERVDRVTFGKIGRHPIDPTTRTVPVYANGDSGGDLYKESGMREWATGGGLDDRWGIVIERASLRELKADIVELVREQHA